MPRRREARPRVEEGASAQGSVYRRPGLHCAASQVLPGMEENLVVVIPQYVSLGLGT